MERTFIYIIENILGNPNIIYVGKTKNPKLREQNHKHTFGYEIKYSIIDEVDSTERKVWGPLESYWIEQFRQWGFKLANGNKGGGGPMFVSEETKKKLRKPKPEGFGERISNANLGKVRTEEHIKNYSKPKYVGFGEKISKAKKGKPSSKKGKKTGPNLKLKGRKSCHKEDTGRKISESKKGKQVNGLKILDVKNNIIFNSKVECAKFHGFNINKMRKLVDENKYFIKIKNIK